MSMLAASYDDDPVDFVSAGPDDAAASIQALWEGLVDRAATHDEIALAERLAHLDRDPDSIQAYMRQQFGRPGFRTLAQFLQALSPQQEPYRASNSDEPSNTVRFAEHGVANAENLRLAARTRGERPEQMVRLVGDVGVTAVSPWAALLWHLPDADFESAAEALRAGHSLVEVGSRLITADEAARRAAAVRPAAKDQTTETEETTEETNHGDDRF